LQETGQVIESFGETVTVTMKRSSVCASCGACGLLAPGASSDIVVEAKNLVGATAGDTVRLQVGTTDYLTATAVVYLLPLAAAIVGFLLGALIAPHTVWSKHTASVAGALFGFVLSFAGIRAYDQKAKREGRCKPSVVEILSTAAQKERD